MSRTARLLALAAIVAAFAACSDNTTNSSSTTTKSSTTTSTLATTTLAVNTTAGSGSSSTDVADRIDQATQALQRGDFSTMLQVLSLTSLGNEIADKAVTVLAPTNAAWSAMSGDDFRSLLADPTKIDNLMRRHVLDGAYTLDQLKGMTTVKTIGGDTLNVTTSGDTVMVEGATLSPVDTTNGTTSQGQDLVVYSIDKVLLPS